MSPGSNPGVRAVAQRHDDLTPFLAATRDGMVATLRHQAEARRHDLLWQPDRVAGAVLELVGALRPDSILVDHLCVAARLALYAGGVPAATFVPGHPSQLPVGDEVYGFPVAWPAWADPDADALAALRRTCLDVRHELADTGNRVIDRIDQARAPVADVFAAHGATVLYNSPDSLRDPGRRDLPPRHQFLGSCVRPARPPDRDVTAWLAHDDPFVYVSLGTFLSARGDVLGRIAAALAATGRRVAMAAGTTTPDELGPLPAHWLVRPFLPQIALIGRAEAVVCHGGNNTVTEVLTAGRPLLVLPLSTDQFAIAADVERAGVGASADPNRSSVDQLVGRIAALDEAGIRAAAARAGAALRATDGPARAVRALGVDCPAAVTLSAW